MLDIEDLQRYVANSHTPRSWCIYDTVKREGVLKAMAQDAAERLAGEMSALALSVPLAVRDHRFVLLYFGATSREDAYNPEPFRPDGQKYDHCNACRTIWQQEMIQLPEDMSEWLCPLCYATHQDHTGGQDVQH